MPFEKYRFYFFSAWHSAIYGERDLWHIVATDYQLNRVFRGPIFCASSGEKCSASPPLIGEKSCLRFVLLGSSQSIGAGANKLEQTFFAHIHRGLRRSLPNKCVESLNLSVSGSNLAELTGIFQKHMAFQPDLVIVNLSNNDPLSGFYGKLLHFAELSKGAYFQVVFLAEANSSDLGYSQELKDKHEIMRRAGKELGIQTLSMQKFLGTNEIRQSGQLWWDSVHLSSYGQALAADWLLPKISAILEKRSHGPFLPNLVDTSALNGATN